MAGTFTSTGSYSNLTRLELEQIRKADFYAGGKALTVGDAGNVGGGTGVGSINAEPYASGPLLAAGNVDWATPPTNPAINYPFRVDTSDIIAVPSYDDPIFWFGPTGLGRFDATVTATNQITKSSGNWTAVNGDIAVIASGHVDNVYAVGTVSAGGGTPVLTLTNIRNAANGTVLTVSGTTHSVIVTRPGVSQLLAVPGSGPLGREQTFMFCTQGSTIHNTLSPTDVAISNARVRNVVPPSFNGVGNDRSDAIFDSPRSIANTVGYRPVFYRGLANGSGPDLASPIATLNPVIDSTIPAADQRLTIDYKAGIVRFSCAPRAGDDIKPTGGIEGVNPTTGRLNLYAVWFAFPTANPATWTPVGAESSKQLYSPRSTSSQGVAPARVYFNGVSWEITPSVAASVASTWANTNTVASTTLSGVLNEIVSDLATGGADKVGTAVGSFAGNIAAIGGGGLLSSNTTIQSALDRVDDVLVARRAYTAVMTDGTASTGGDFNSAALFASVNTLGSGKYFVRRGAYTTAVDLSTVYGAAIIGEASGLVTLAASANVKLVASDDAAVHEFENVYFTVSSATAKYNFIKHKLVVKNCRAQAGTFTLDFSAPGLPTRLDIDGLLVDTDNSIDADNAVFVSNNSSSDSPITGKVKNLQIRRVNSLNSASVAKYALRLDSLSGSGTDINETLTFENCVIDPSTGFGAGSGAVLRIEDSTQPLVFRDCLIRCSQVSSFATVLEVIDSNNILFDNCRFVQEGEGPLLSLRKNGTGVNGVTFLNCRFYSSPVGTVLEDDFNVSCEGSSPKPISFIGCYLEVRNGSGAALPRVTLNRLNDTNLGNGPILIDGFEIVINYAAANMNADFFVMTSGVTNSGLSSVRNLSFNFSLKRLYQNNARAVVFIGNTKKIPVTNLTLEGVAEPESGGGATDDTCRLVALYNASVSGGEVLGTPQVSNIVYWKALVELNEPFDSVSGVTFWGDSNAPNKGRLIRTTGVSNKNNLIDNNTVTVGNLAATETAVGWFCSVNTSGTKVVNNSIVLTGNTGSLLDNTDDDCLISLNSDRCTVMGNTTATITGLRHIEVTGDRNTVVGNTITGTLNSADIQAIKVRSTAEGTIVVGNTAINDDGTYNATISDSGTDTIGANIVATDTWDPASIPNGSSAIISITATGAVLGDRVIVGHSVGLQGLTSTAYVSGSNAVVVVLNNATGSAIDLVSHTVTVEILKSRSLTLNTLY